MDGWCEPPSYTHHMSGDPILRGNGGENQKNKETRVRSKRIALLPSWSFAIHTRTKPWSVHRMGSGSDPNTPEEMCNQWQWETTMKDAKGTCQTNRNIQPIK